ncbi:hypothetical protein SAMN05216296_1976 [Pseudomonas pohangensis]|uniref:Beta-barrel assembly machine subunit BamF n=1 Tax=Pseudomonas pohangensis TaxID=364197 RepID=A0A1H2G226_9PSED|nr:hypothetical protein [Pseudomonas pohangensis]SDU13565.1 hypothetical protein SAMN05216296_1976 [Pseudomonas pohangensis]
MTKPYLAVLAIALAAYSLGACSTNPYSQQSLPTQKPDAEAVQAQLQASEADAAIIRQLPADADIENMSEQRRLFPQRLYLTWNGQRRDLEAKPVTAANSQPASSQAPTSPVRKRATTTQESITLDELPPPIVIE